MNISDFRVFKIKFKDTSDLSVGAFLFVALIKLFEMGVNLTLWLTVLFLICRTVKLGLML